MLRPQQVTQPQRQLPSPISSTFSSSPRSEVSGGSFSLGIVGGGGGGDADHFDVGYSNHRVADRTPPSVGMDARAANEESGFKLTPIAKPALPPTAAATTGYYVLLFDVVVGGSSVEGGPLGLPGPVGFPSSCSSSLGSSPSGSSGMVSGKGSGFDADDDDDGDGDDDDDGAGAGAGFPGGRFGLRRLDRRGGGVDVGVGGEEDEDDEVLFGRARRVSLGLGMVTVSPSRSSVANVGRDTVMKEVPVLMERSSRPTFQVWSDDD
ncbi:uncharacterized protein EI90DRAFT_3119900 [Cantharellus anzutake]|uniref:uncharacterized protein n=1 Tax=Cantharellus anzutake TaxID=1750568 RepID=UPI001907520F|nr:uncharacterized protein EI90DRAFT_3119900 [Cantharellus anzutake]KAF8335671.1 hypothetical protein EI90DRAFT_3119900 [Cantharellus anzutake]